MTTRADLHRGSGLAFLFSMPRSGSTAFSMMLGTHSAILSPPEPWILLSLADLLGVGNLQRIPYGEESVLLATVKYFNRIAAAGEGPWLGAAIGRAARARLAGAAPEMVLRDLSSDLYAKNLSLCGKRLFLDKTPRYYRILHLLDRIFPLARKIFLVRNPMDVASSYKSTWKVSIDKISGHAVHAISYDFCNGLFQLERYFARRNATKLVVNYEALVRDPRSVLSQTCGFLDVPFEPGMLTFYRNAELICEHRGAVVGDPRATTSPSPLDVNSIDKWRTELNTTEKQQLAAALGGGIFERLGYPEVLAQLKTDDVEVPAAKLAQAHRRTVTRQLTAGNAHVRADRYGALGRMADGLLAERSSHVKAISKLASDLSAAGADRQQLRQTSEHLSAQKTALEQEREAALEALRRLTADIAALDEERQGLRQAKERLTTEKSALEQDRNAKAEVIVRLTAELTAMDANLQSTRQTNERLAAEKAALDANRKALLEANQRLTRELSALTQDREAKSAAIEKMTSELSALRESGTIARQHIETLKDELRALNAEAQALWAEGTRLQEASIASQKSTVEARAQAAAAQEAMTSQAKSHAEQVNTLAVAIEELRQQADHASARIKALTRSLADTQRAEKNLRSLNGSLNDQLQSAVNQIKALTAWVHEARDEAQSLQAAYDKTLARGVVRIARRLRRPWDRSFGKHEK